MSDTTTVTVDATSTDTTATTATKPTDDQTTDQLGDKGKQALDSERQARKDAEKRARDAEKRLADIEAAKAEADEEEAKRKGEFEQLAEQRRVKLEEAETARETEKQRAERAITLLAAQIEGRVKAIRDLDADLLTGFPEDGDALTQIEWLDDPRTVKAVERTKSGNDAQREQLGAIPGTRQPAGPVDKAKADDAARRAQRQATRTSF
jgi:hypothetical protein